MLDLGLVGFAQPWLLVALVALPALWLLLRIMPPAPRRIAFPALLFLMGLVARERTPARTPWWLLLLRLMIAALLILAFAGPLLNPAPRLGGSGPVLLVIDDGWATAPTWAQRRDLARGLLDQAMREDREVAVLRTAPRAQRMEVERVPAKAALDELATWQPQPWSVDRAAALEALTRAGLERASVFWLSDGITDRPAAADGAARLGEALRRLGPVRGFADDTAVPALVRLVDARTTILEVEALRASGGPATIAEARAVGSEGEVLGRALLRFAGGATSATASFGMPLELRNRIARVELGRAGGVGQVFLLDERWRRRTVGVAGELQAATTQPLLAERYFIERALAPHAEIRAGSIEELTEAPLSMLVMTDVGRVDPAQRQRLERWMNDGGVVLRFAGPRLAGSGDDFVPVPLRAGDRALGGALSWAEPLSLAPFDPQGVFAGLRPGPETQVSRQVLAQPGPDLTRATLAALEDGTPLITGVRRGKGWLVLVHTTANTTWTSLPLSGLFVDMLQRLLALAPGTGGALQAQVTPHEVLDAFGRLVEPRGGAEPAPAMRLAQLVPGPAHPPGLWQPLQALEVAGEAAGSDIARVALNIQQGLGPLAPLAPNALGAEAEGFARHTEVNLAPWLLLAALVLALVDLVVGYAMRGLLPLRAAAAGLLLMLSVQGAAFAQEPDEARIVDLTRQTRLAYVMTGVVEVDEQSAAGLLGLTRVLAQRTSVEAGEPTPVDIDSDDLALFPILYWPVPPEHRDLSPATVDRVESYLRQGGMILFDTRDAGMLIPGQLGGGPGEARLRELLGEVDLPPLQPLPEAHVLTRSFYLLQDFPGRWTGQPLWVDQAAPGINDGVSTVIVGAHEWSGAWAVDEAGDSLYPVVPGGETQREMARRFGVNVVMYALTGNYKTDQVHVPALLERLGQ